MDFKIRSFFTRSAQNNKIENRGNAHNTEKLNQSTLSKAQVHSPSPLGTPSTQQRERKATIFSQLNSTEGAKKTTPQKIRTKASEFFKSLIRNIVDLKKVIEATSIYNANKKSCLSLDQNAEREELKRQLKGELNLGDLHRFKVTIGDAHFDASATDQEIQEKKEQALLAFCNQDKTLYENILKTAHQGLPASISNILTVPFFNANFTTGTTDSSANQGLKEIMIKRDNEGNIHCTVQVPFPVLPLARQEHPLITIKASVTVVIPKEELKIGNVDRAVFKSSVELI